MGEAKNSFICLIKRNAKLTNAGEEGLKSAGEIKYKQKISR